MMRRLSVAVLSGVVVLTAAPRAQSGRPITDSARGAGNPTWSPDGKTIAFNAATGPDAAKVNDRESDVKVVTSAVYRENGNPTYVDVEHHTHIFTIKVPVDPTDKSTAA